ncbi:hypothetical protein Droror1_Dr00025383 [Drosera rotundifolia]
MGRRRATVTAMGMAAEARAEGGRRMILEEEEEEEEEGEGEESSAQAVEANSGESKTHLDSAAVEKNVKAAGVKP